MFGSYQGRQVNSNYVAATDGIVCALITGPNRDEISDVRLDGMVNGQLIGQACGFCPVPFGEVCFPGSLAFPVPKGANWEVKRTDDPNNQTSLTVAVFWMPIGATQISADDKPVAEFTNMSSTAFKPREDLESAMVNLVDVLATVLKQSFTGEERAALVDAIKRLI